MEIRLLRVDSRLLHGQVATNWAKVLKVGRIIVVSDQVARDNIRKTLIKQASPPGIKVHVIPLMKMLRIYFDPRFNSFKALILVEDPADACFLIENGIQVDQINIGALSFESSRKMVTDSISVNQKDIAALQWIHDQGIKLDIRKVYGDSSKDLWKILREKGLVETTKQ
ncbi:mannose/fructose/sorbose-specific PTS system IIB component [Ligilactobacillus salitolerans]|uniref:Mannose/fructose/sorbose-specific PTS system IIB component n=1 Tax=Ligilactobacillus salitolerans TaxID=1808352 RepID=A0A401IQA8_9LACO|nr:PTS sugar transporter subunit IIB [Ligilactobacillus salitolerans]GBG93706.1 mannose/fructose/sorbose-specific PTS system IIB component [Ligilactobacillus salitolerans]